MGEVDGEPSLREKGRHNRFWQNWQESRGAFKTFWLQVGVCGSDGEKWLDGIDLPALGGITWLGGYFIPSCFGRKKDIGGKRVRLDEKRRLAYKCLTRRDCG